MADLYKVHYAHTNGGEVEYYENEGRLFVDLLQHQLDVEAESRKPWLDRMLARAFTHDKSLDRRKTKRIIGVYKRVGDEWVQMRFHYTPPKVWLEDPLDTPTGD
jgi:hypothetical protein